MSLEHFFMNSFIMMQFFQFSMTFNSEFSRFFDECHYFYASMSTWSVRGTAISIEIYYLCVSAKLQMTNEIDEGFNGSFGNFNRVRRLIDCQCHVMSSVKANYLLWSAHYSQLFLIFPTKIAISIRNQIPIHQKIHFPSHSIQKIAISSYNINTNARLNLNYIMSFVLSKNLYLIKFHSQSNACKKSKSSFQ